MGKMQREIIRDYERKQKREIKRRRERKDERGKEKEREGEKTVLKFTSFILQRLHIRKRAFSFTDC